MVEKPALPDWPLLMDLRTAALFVSFTQREFRALVALRIMPPPREPVPGKLRWHKQEIEQAAARMYDLDGEVSAEEARRATWKAIENFDPTQLTRRKGARPLAKPMSPR